MTVAHITRPEHNAFVYLLPFLVAGVVIAVSLQPVAGWLVLAGVFGVFSFAYPFPVLLGMIAVLPIAPAVMIPLPIHDISSLARFVLFAAVLLRRIVFLQPLKSWLLGHRLTKALLLYSLIALVSVVVFNRPLPLSEAALMRWASYLCGYYSLTALLDSDERVILVLKTLMFSTIGTALFAFYQFAVSDYSQLWLLLHPPSADVPTLEPWSQRAPSTFVHFNSFAAYLNLVIPFALGFWLFQDDKKLRRLGACTAIFSVIALFLTQSRGGVAGFLAMVLVCIWAKSKSTYVFLKRLFLFATVGALGMLAIGQVFQRLADTDSLGRFVIWGAAITLFRLSPWIGVGFGNFRELYGDLIPGYAKVLDAHNLYFQLLSETGIIGFVVFFVVIVMSMRLAGRLSHPSGLRKVIGIGALGAFWSLLVHGTVDYVFNVCPPFAMLLFVIFALLTIYKLPSQAKPQSSMERYFLTHFWLPRFRVLEGTENIEASRAVNRNQISVHSYPV